MALQELRAYYARLAANALADADYLKQLGEGVNRMSSEADKNEAMFNRFRVLSATIDREMEEYLAQSAR